MLKIECDDPATIAKFFESTIAAKVEVVEARAETARISDRLYTSQDKQEEQRHEIANLTEQLRISKANPPMPQWDKLLIEMIAAVQGDNKINAIKVVRQITGFGLKESKDLVELALKDGDVIRANRAKPIPFASGNRW